MFGIQTKSMLLALAVLFSNAAGAALFQASFDNLVFSDGATVNGTIVYDDSLTLLDVDLTGVGGLFSPDTVNWLAGDVFDFNNTDPLVAVNKTSASYTNASFFALGTAGEDWTEVGNFAIGFSQVNRDFSPPANLASGAITISAVSAVPAPAGITLLLSAVGLMGISGRMKRKQQYSAPGA